MRSIILILSLILTSTLFGREPKLSSKEVKQGEFFILTLPETGDYRITFPQGRTPIRTFPREDYEIAFVPVHYSTPPGSYPLKVERDGEFLLKEEVEIKDGEFEKSYIRVTSATEKKKSKKNVEVMVNYAREARKDSSQIKLWEGEFIYPLNGRITTSFGATRYVNNKLSGYHSGVDFAVPVGVPVLATNRGRVVLSMYLKSTGNTIIIDHGLNLYSSYSHMDSREVETGDIVEKGKVIGASGNTGFSTGPHLHFTMSVGNTFVDPFLFIERKLID